MTRRTFLQKAAGAMIGLAVASASSDPEAPLRRIVDAHTHFYDPNRVGGVPWPKKDSPLYRTVLPKDWLAVASPLGVTDTIVVEASEWLEDNAWILELARREKQIVGFIGHLLPHEIDFPKHLKRFAADPLFRGVRVSGDDFLDHVERPEFRAGAGLMADLALTLEINGPPAAHGLATKLAAAMPALRIMIDHVGSAGDPAHLSDEWRRGMAALGKHPKVFCKVSALTEQTDAAGRQSGSAPRDTAYYAPILDHCRNCFGEDRLVYGSNWPVCEKGGSYADQFRIVSEYFAQFGPAASDKYFFQNARAAYG